ncbi:ABC transporter ATP-binding protein [Herbaspirillum lusitanum]|uniref:ABC transporter ATP-binding protein n=1 Tax=Herbaspirillum lusitanum TaxID=213312 RepID=A0ABW9A6P6_9BURK
MTPTSIPDSAAHASVAALEVQSLSSAVVEPTSFTLQAGECVAIRGVSGAGKTRLLRLIADLDPGQGEVLLYGQARGRMPAPLWRRQVVYQGAESNWWENTAAAHFSVQQLPFVHDLLPRLALTPDRLEADITQLSTGERQRMALIRSLAVTPRVLLLDEPTSALDADNVRRVEAVLAERMQAGLVILIVTHSEEQGLRMAGRDIEIHKRSQP